MRHECLSSFFRPCSNNNAGVADACQQFFLHISAPVPCHLAGDVTTDTDSEALLTCSPTTIPSMAY